MSHLRELRGDRGSLRDVPIPRAPVLAPTLGQAFDRVVIAFLLTPSAVSGNGLYPPVTLVEIPPRVDRAEVSGLAVSGEPVNFWLGRCWWTLEVQGGPLQEWSAAALLDPTNSGLAAGPNALVSGVRYSPFGSLAAPLPVSIQLAAQSVLRLRVWGPDVVDPNALVPLTIHARTIGLVHYSRGG